MENEKDFILIIEDDPIILEMLEEFLELLGFPYKSTSDGTEGRKLLLGRGQDIRVVFCDVMLGDRNGIDLIRDFREHWKTVPVIFSSGYTSQDVLFKGCIEQENCFFLKKPFSLDQLKKILKKAMVTSKVD